MRNVVIILLMIIAFTSLSAQQPGAIEIRKNFWGTIYRQHDQKLSAAGLMEKLKENPVALSEMKKARNSINTYNSGLGKSSWKKPQLNLGFTRQGMGMKLSF